MNSLNKPQSVFKELYHREYLADRRRIISASKDDLSLIQRLGRYKTLSVHKGCVNTICWNEQGNLILSGSDDQHLVVTDGFTYKQVFKYQTAHSVNIFSAKFLPCTNDQQMVSCSGDGLILYTDLNKPVESRNNKFTCHQGTTAYEVVTVPNDPSTFLSCGEDGTVRCFDLRTKSSCHKQKCKDDILVSCNRAVTALTINPSASYQLAVGCSDSVVRIYDRRYLSSEPRAYTKAQPVCVFIAPKLNESSRYYRITSLNYDESGKEMLVSYSSDNLYLFNIQENRTKILKKSPSVSISTNNNKRVFSPLARIREIRRRQQISPPPVRRLRLRGDWSDTGPDARPERENVPTVNIGQARPQLQATLMQRMTDVLSRMLNDPMTRAALSAGGEDSVEERLLENRQLQQADVAAAEHESMDEGIANQQPQQQPQQSQSEPATPSQEVTNTNDDTASSGGTTMTSHLRSHLTALRDLREGFINQHGSEPSVSFRYSHQSTSNSTISLRVGNDNMGTSSSNDPDSGNVVDDFDSMDDSTVPSTSENIEDSEEPMNEQINMTDNNLDCNNESDGEDCCISEAFEKTDVKYNNLYKAKLKKKFMGHRNARTMIKEAAFWGSDYVMSGSDCGHVFIWNRHSGDLVMLLRADHHVVNCLQPHPTLPILATSGIDHDIKLWSPIVEEPDFDTLQAKDLIKRNAIMLEETRDTITVPAAFMIRMLACLNQIRRRTRRNTNEGDS